MGIALALAGLLVRPAAAATGLSPTLPEAVSPNGARVKDLYDLISVPALLVFLIVESLLLAVILRFRRSRQPTRVPPQWHGNKYLEILWTAVPLLIILSIGALSFRELQKDFIVVGDVTAPSEGRADVEITVTAYLRPPATQPRFLCPLLPAYWRWPCMTAQTTSATIPATTRSPNRKGKSMPIP